MTRYLPSLILAVAALTACSSETPVTDDDGGTGGMGGTSVEPETIPVLGDGEHDVAAVELVTIGSAADGLVVPRDLAFNPGAPDQLWVVNRGDESMVVFTAVGQPAQQSSKYSSFGTEHFMARPSSLAFGEPGVMATCHETDQLTQGNQTPPDFMGPTLWPTDMNLFDAGHGSHLDMLHNSPLSTGIAWHYDRVFFVFDGYHNAITRYDFGADHGMGGADHGDGFVLRYVEGQVARVAEVSSHMDFVPGTNLLYIADTGNNRIAVLDVGTGTQGAPLFPNYDGDQQFNQDGAVITTLVDGTVSGNWWPSGLAIFGDHLYVTDNASSTIYGYSMEGELIDWLPLGLPEGSLQGITLDAEGRIYVVDVVGNQVLRIAAKPPAP